jgi:PAS domain S-box-containing protein
MDRVIRILIVEDVPADAALAQREISRVLHPVEFTRVDTESDFIRALDEFNPDLIVSDYSMPSFDGMSALKIAMKRVPYTPFIIHTGSINEDTAVECMKAGATDYIIKEYIKRLGPAVKQALESKNIKIEMKKSHEALIESEERFRRLAENADDIIYRYELYPSLRISYVSPSATRITGYSTHELYSDPEIYQKLLHQEDRNYINTLLSNRDGKTQPATVRWITKDKNTIWIEQKNVPVFNSSGKVVAFEGIARDITNRKRDEDNQQILYEIAMASIEAKSLEDLLVTVREQLKKVIDTSNFYTSLYDKTTDSLKKILYINELENLTELEAENFLSDHVINTGKTLLLTKDELESFSITNNINLSGYSAECWLGVPITAEESVVGLMAVMSYSNPKAFDKSSARLMELIAHELSIVFQRTKMIQDLIIAKERAEESDRLKMAFLSNISHEIRTPMNGILGFLDLLRDPELDEEQKERFMEIVNSSSQRMLDTINDIVELSKIESGQSEINNSLVDIPEIMRFYFNLFYEQARKKGIKFSLESRIQGDNSQVLTDKYKIGSIINNLLNNSIKFTDNGSIILGNYCENGSMVFYVKDTGIGIPVSRHSAIFERFVQADLNITRPYEGSGLGLSIVKAYAEALGGRVWLESEPGKGSTFFFSVPCKILTETKEVVLCNSSHVKKVDRIIVVAEDDEIGFLFLNTVLKREGFSVIHCKNGPDTIEKVKQNPDIILILMDIRMPGMSGFEATKIIREFNKDIPIIAQTALAFGEDKMMAIEAGCNDYISKPILSDTLISIIRKYSD